MRRRTGMEIDGWACGERGSGGAIAGSDGAPPSVKLGRTRLARASRLLSVLGLASGLGSLFGPGLIVKLLRAGPLGVWFGFVVSPCLLVLSLAFLIAAVLTRRAARR
jgi:hypothetical protein